MPFGSWKQGDYSERERKKERKKERERERERERESKRISINEDSQSTKQKHTLFYFNMLVFVVWSCSIKLHNTIYVQAFEKCNCVSRLLNNNPQKHCFIQMKSGFCWNQPHKDQKYFSIPERQKEMSDRRERDRQRKRRREQRESQLCDELWYNKVAPTHIWHMQR